MFGLIKKSAKPDSPYVYYGSFIIDLKLSVLFLKFDLTLLKFIKGIDILYRINKFDW